MKRTLLILTLLFLAMPVFLLAQSSGKIIGVVTDKATGEPLPGVNVSLDGTTMGAATDVDGYYVILNVPVGTYTIRASFIGYKEVAKEGIRVSASTTTEINFELEEAAIEGEAVVVTATRPLVEKHVTQSISLVTSEQLENIPVRGFNEVVALQNSVVFQDGNLYIRGGRREETGYYVEGAAAINPMTNRQAVFIIQEAVEEFQVLAGGYTAEFGGANAGIIRTELKTGTPDYHFLFDVQSDKPFADPGEKFLGTYSYEHLIGVATVSGPVPGTNNKVRFFLAGEYDELGDKMRRFSKGFRFENLVDSNPLNPDVAAGHPDTVRVLEYPDGFTPHNFQMTKAINGTILFDTSPVRFRIGGIYSFQKDFNDNAPMLNILNGRLWSVNTNSLLLTGKATYVINPKSYLEANVSFFNFKTERDDAFFGTDWRSWFDSTKVQEQFGITFRDRRRPQFNYRLHGFEFSRNGTPLTNFYVENKQNYIGGALNYVNQIGRHHELKIGVDARAYTVRRFVIEAQDFMTLVDQAGGNENAVDPEDILLQAGYGGFGYDLHGNEINDDISIGDSIFIDGPRKPVFAAAYIHDKIEFNDLIINAGLRLDYFDTDDRTLIDPTNPVVDQKTNLIRPEAFKEKDPVTQLSPRLGISFPVSEKTVFYAQYGKFIQMPRLEQIYRSIAENSTQIVVAGFFFRNPIGFGLDPIRSTSYELGFRQQLSSVAAFDITGFYRNEKGQITVEKVEKAPDATISSYTRLANGDFVTTKGLEFRLTLRRTNRIQAQLNYTLTDAEGTGSTEVSYHAAIDRNTPKPTVITPLDFNQTHRGAIMVDYRFGKNDGGPILERLGANLLFSFNSGHPFTRVTGSLGQFNDFNAGVRIEDDTRTRKAIEPLNASRTPWNFNIDLRLDKTVTLANQLDATFYVRVLNLLNTRNVLNVYQRTGDDKDDGFLSNPALSEDVINKPNNGQNYVDLYRAINLENGQAYWSELGKQLWGHPRQILFGVRFNY
ncbi:MAG: TonB-dependent receptor [Calditrichaeota bacterium]|nr:MAG: TonB-dependent receptor [Calditrichota bacterium]